MPNTFQEQLIRARREQIITAAIEVIAEQGFPRTTIKQIARRAGIADGTIYNYFENKEAILMGIIERVTESEVREVHFAEAKQIDFEQFVTAYVAHRMQEVEADYALFKIILTETIVNAALRQRINEQVYAPAFVFAEQYLAHLMAEGHLETADPQVTARLFASPLMGLLLLRLLGDEHVTAHWDTYTAAVIQFLLKAHRNQGESDETID